MKQPHLHLMVLAIGLADTAAAHPGNHDSASGKSGLVHYVTSLDHAGLLVLAVLLGAAWFCHTRARSPRGK